MAARGLVVAAMGAGLLLLGACGWEISRNTAADESGIDAGVTSVRLASDSGDVKIRAGDRAVVRRTVHYDNDRPGATHRVEGDVLVLDSCPVRNCWVDYDVTVPAGTTVTGRVDSGTVEVDGVAGVNLEASSGDVTVRGVSGRVNVNSDSGEVKVDDIGDTVAVRTQSGSVTLDNVRAGITVHADSGKIEARGVGGAADLRSDSGSVSVQLTAAQDVRANTDSGALTVTVPRAGYRVTTSTDSGEVDNGVTDDPAGAHRLELRTDSGDITVRYA